MKPISFPAKISMARQELILDCYSAGVQDELWSSIQSDRLGPKRNGIWPGIDSIEALTEYMKSCDTSNPRSEELGYIIRDASGQLAGTFHVTSLSWVDGSAELGYWLHHRFTGRGLATTAVRLMEESLRTMGFNRSIIQCQEWNAKSWTVAERAGYRLVYRAHKDKVCPGCDDCTRSYEKRLSVSHE